MEHVRLGQVLKPGKVFKTLSFVTKELPGFPKKGINLNTRPESGSSAKGETLSQCIFYVFSLKSYNLCLMSIFDIYTTWEKKKHVYFNIRDFS